MNFELEKKAGGVDVFEILLICFSAVVGSCVRRLSSSVFQRLGRLEPPRRKSCILGGMGQPVGDSSRSS